MDVPAREMPTIGYFSIDNESIYPREDLRSRAIHDINSIIIKSSIIEEGCMEIEKAILDDMKTALSAVTLPRLIAWSGGSYPQKELLRHDAGRR